MTAGPVAVQFEEQPLLPEHDSREDGLQSGGGAAPASGAEKKATPFPWRNLMVLMALNSICPLAFELIYPFVNAMIVEIGVTDDPERVGFYSGLIESVFSLMSLLTILPFGYISDRVGRKPVVLFGEPSSVETAATERNRSTVGMGGLAISIVCFGLSKSLVGMILSRCIGGALGASWAAIKVMTGEMTDRSNQGTAFSIMNVSYRLGQIVGLPLGGLLAHPERRWKSFDTPFWREYPFLLPCLVGASFAIISVGFGIVFIEETLPSKVRARRKAKQASYDSITTPTPQSDPTTPLLINSDTEIGANARPARKAPWREIMTPSVLALLSNNACMCIASEMLFSVYPLFAFTPILSGGLGMTEAQIGISQMSIVLPQAISPALANSLFAASVEKHILGGNLVWVCLFIFTCLGAIHSLLLKEPEMDWRTKQHDERDD
ncbi:hypothetical protein FRC07_000572 [Ceratobasidium sp. 392]|nr:hypothetical protein FRC07_000572 [Ceratobasidium sp. 392]